MGTYKKTIDISTRTLKSDDSVLTDRTDDSDDLDPIIDSVLLCEGVHIPTDTWGTKALSIVYMACAFCVHVFNNISVIFVAGIPLIRLWTFPGVPIA